MKKLLVANRGEIAIRILCAARELRIHAVAIYHGVDDGHVRYADSAHSLPSASSFMDISHLVSLCTRHGIDGVHAGYGFLSESAAFASALESSGITFVGPPADVLAATGDKLAARRLAADAGVPVLPALEGATDSVDVVREFARTHAGGYPVMLKAVDGGGGRGIRLVRSEQELEGALQRALAESPSRKVFAEKALVDGCRHIEVQILGDGKNVRHYWERECSIQRRYQKVVEIAPSTLRNGHDDELASKIISSALQIASRIGYRSLGTFEFLASPFTGAFYFLEINPRLQVEHTVTEAITGADLVRQQLLVASGHSLSSVAGPGTAPSAGDPPPRGQEASIQLRVTAEDARRGFALSVGKIRTVTLPSGQGTRVDSHVAAGTVVSADYDSLLAKVVVTAADRDAATAKGLRALADLQIDGVTTNADLLAGILLSDAFRRGGCDTRWLEQNVDAATESGAKFLKSRSRPSGQSRAQDLVPDASSLGGGVSVRKGDAWNLSVSGTGANSKDSLFDQTVTVQKVTRNDLPHNLTAEIQGTDGASYALKLSQADATNMGVSGAGAKKRQADPKNPDHLMCPLSGQLVEMLVDEGDEVKEFESVAIVKQMKMELEVRAHKKGTIKSIWDVDDGENVENGMLVCEIVDDSRPREKL